MSVKMKPIGKLIILLLLVGAGVYAFKMYRDKHPVPASQDNPQNQSLDNLPPSELLLNLAGSNTIGDTLAPALAKAYLESRNYTSVSILTTGKDEKAVIGTLNGKQYRIGIAAHGTSTGFSVLGNGADICMASSPAPAGAAFKENIIALDGIAVITGSTNHLPELAIADLRKIFSGEVNQWDGIAGSGKTGKINVCRMDDNSGTFKMFSEMVMGGQTIANRAKTFEKSTEMVSAVASDANAIGFVSYVYLNGKSGIRAVPISAETGYPAIFPNALTIQSEKYVLCRRLYMYTAAGSKPESNDLVHFISDKKGQEIVENIGFINLSINNDNPVSLPGDPAGYKDLIANYKKITSELRFNFGSADLDSRAVADLDRIVDYLAKPGNNRKQIVLAGFTDNVGDIKKNIALSIERANSVRKLLEQKGATVKEVVGFGPARPVHSNATEADRSANRRVEVWMTN